jgi:hypothetical protein
VTRAASAEAKALEVGEGAKAERAAAAVATAADEKRIATVKAATAEALTLRDVAVAQMKKAAVDSAEAAATKDAEALAAMDALLQAHGCERTATGNDPPRALSLLPPPALNRTAPGDAGMFRAPGLAGSTLAPVADASMGNGDDSHGRRDDSLPTNLERYPKRRRGTDGQTFNFASSTSAPVPTLIPASRTSAKTDEKVNDVTIAGDFLETPVLCSMAMPGIDGVIDFLYFAGDVYCQEKWRLASAGPTGKVKCGYAEIYYKRYNSDRQASFSPGLRPERTP